MTGQELSALALKATMKIAGVALCIATIFACFAFFPFWHHLCAGETSASMDRWWAFPLWMTGCIVAVPAIASVGFGTAYALLSAMEQTNVE
jgi:hypothetical protein